MKKLASNLPLQEMIRQVISTATEKQASDESATADRVRNTISPNKAPQAGAKAEVEQTLTGSDFVEKLASACDLIAANVHNIEVPPQSVLKQASEGSPQGAGKGQGALQVHKSIGGEQKYKKDKPAGEDAAASTADKKLSAGGLPGGKTQLDNDMHDAPGGGDVKPTGKYPEKGPLVAGPTVKHASPQRPQLATGVKTAAAAKALILRKLAGEDVLKANISAERTADPLAGKGQLTSTDASQASPGQAGDPVSGMGNQGRKHIQSNDAARNYTQGDAKGPQKTQLSQILDEPALSPAHDSKLRENLQNAGSAGVKIAAARKTVLAKIASEGCQCGGNGECKYCQLKAAVKTAGSKKTANAMMGYGGGGGGMMPPPPQMSGGMGAMAEAGAGADGCMCGGTGECRVCKLKAALAAAKATGAMPVEKDSTMGDAGQGTNPASGMY